ncbi:MAG: DUF393 domain-containing protein [SAR202 cluster bacterium]|nr:DUF393 domain-containing protein [SAR202 cluster bacterium]
MADEKKKPAVYYDGECKFCAASVGLVKGRQEDESMEYRPSQGIEQLPAGLTRQDVHRQLWLVLPDGRKYGGFHAVRRLAWRRPWFWPLAALLWLPGMGWLGPVVYRWVARNRYRLGGVRKS